jgi:hypothetical protein
MEKDALIRIIIQDIRELDTLLNTFTGKSEIPKAFIQLSRNKTKGVLEEIDLLESLNNTTVNQETLISEPKQNEQVIEVIQKPEKSIDKIVNEKIIDKIVNEEIIELDQKPEEKKIKPIKKETVAKPEENIKKPEPITLGEKLMQGNQSFYDTLTQKKETAQEQMFQNRPVKNILSAIGINDRFYFQKELFGGDAELFNSIIAKLNLLNDMESAEKMFAESTDWDENNEAVQAFKNIIKRRYL